MTTYGKHEHFHAQLEAITNADERERYARDELRCLVADAKDMGISWEAIGAALGVTKQAAWERFRPHVTRYVCAAFRCKNGGRASELHVDGQGIFWCDEHKRP